MESALPQGEVNTTTQSVTEPLPTDLDPTASERVEVPTTPPRRRRKSMPRRSSNWRTFNFTPAVVNAIVTTFYRNRNKRRDKRRNKRPYKPTSFNRSAHNARLTKTRRSKRTTLSLGTIAPALPIEDAMNVDTDASMASMAVLSPDLSNEDAMDIHTEAPTTELPLGGSLGTRWCFFGVPGTRGE